MDKTTLVKDDIFEGEKLIKHLDTTNFKVNSALWFYNSDLNEWRLTLASECLDKFGPKKAYGFVQKELGQITPPINIELNNITIIGAKNELINLLGFVIKTGDKDISGIRLSRIVINGTMIEDVYIYRIT